MTEQVPPFDEPLQPSDIPAQSQDDMPADEYKMEPEPDYVPRFPGVGKLEGKTAFITGGDSGIGRAVAVLFAREGANIAIGYLDEDTDARDTQKLCEDEGADVLLIKGDLGSKSHAEDAVQQVVDRFGGLNVLVNNAAQQWLDKGIDGVTEEHLDRTLKSNICSYMWCSQAAVPHMGEGDSIINTTSVNAFAGMGTLLAYSTTKGANLAFSRSLAGELVKKGIRVNAVAPGPIWTPFIPGSMPAPMVKGFGKKTPMKRPGQPWEVATSYLFLASSDGSYFSGQTLHPNGGMVVGA